METVEVKGREFVISTYTSTYITVSRELYDILNTTGADFDEGVDLWSASDIAYILTHSTLSEDDREDLEIIHKLLHEHVDSVHVEGCANYVDEEE